MAFQQKPEVNFQTAICNCYLGTATLPQLAASLQNNRNRNCKLRKQDGMLEEKEGNHYSFTAPCAMPL